MDFQAAHSGYVIASYALSFILLGGLVFYVLGRDRRLNTEVQRLERSRRKEAP
jgi:heme exporter protein CcmD